MRARARAVSVSLGVAHITTTAKCHSHAQKHCDLSGSDDDTSSYHHIIIIIIKERFITFDHSWSLDPSLLLSFAHFIALRATATYMSLNVPHMSRHVKGT